MITISAREIWEQSQDWLPSPVVLVAVACRNGRMVNITTPMPLSFWKDALQNWGTKVGEVYDRHPHLFPADEI